MTTINFFVEGIAKNRFFKLLTNGKYVNNYWLNEENHWDFVLVN